MTPILEKDGDTAVLWLHRPKPEDTGGMFTVRLRRDEVAAMHKDLGAVLAAFETDDALAGAVGE